MSEITVSLDLSTEERRALTRELGRTLTDEAVTQWAESVVYEALSQVVWWNSRYPAKQSARAEAVR